MQKCLMLGAGHSPLKRKFVAPNSVPDDQTEWVSLDMNPDCKPDVLFELGTIEQGGELPFHSGEFDEIHAYDVLEHYGQQGDFKGFFRGFKELWRVLRLGGYLLGNTPMWNDHWAWGDPGHTRVITAGTLSYLTRAAYENLGKDARTDYRRYIDPRWWELCAADERKDDEGTATGGFFFALRKVT
jgi:SAM-dependent methyltransferase